MDMEAISFNNAEPFEQIVITPLTEGTIVKSGENWSNAFREEDVKQESTVCLKLLILQFYTCI